MSESQGQTRVKPFKEQRPFLKADKRYLGYVSGVGAGKTFSGIVRTIRNMTEWNPGTMGAIIAPTRQMIVNVIIPEMRGLGLFDKPVNWEYKSAYSDEPGIHAPNGSRALILSADNKQTVERLRGLNLSWVWMDERTAIPNRAQEIAMQRLRIGEYRNLYITTTPKGKDDTYDFFVGDVDATKERFGKATLYETEDRRAIVGVPTSANPHTPDDYKEAMEGDMPDQIRAQEVQGQFIEIGSGIFRPEQITFVSPDDVNSSWQLRTIIGVDPAATVDAHAAEENDSDYWGVCVTQIHERTNTVLVTDTSHRRGLSLQEGVDWIRNIARKSNNPDVIVESNQGQIFLQNALVDAGIKATPVKTTRNKENKLMDLTIPIENDTIQFVDWNTDSEAGTNHPYQELSSQMLAFPDGSHDDLLDALHLCVDNAPIAWGSTILSGDIYNSSDSQN